METKIPLRGEQRRESGQVRYGGGRGQQSEGAEEVGSTGRTRCNLDTEKGPCPQAQAEVSVLLLWWPPAPPLAHGLTSPSNPLPHYLPGVSPFVFFYLLNWSCISFLSAPAGVTEWQIRNDIYTCPKLGATFLSCKWVINIKFKQIISTILQSQGWSTKHTHKNRVEPCIECSGVLAQLRHKADSTATTAS